MNYSLSYLPGDFTVLPESVSAIVPPTVQEKSQKPFTGPGGLGSPAAPAGVANGAPASTGISWSLNLPGESTHQSQSGTVLLRIDPALAHDLGIGTEYLRL